MWRPPSGGHWYLGQAHHKGNWVDWDEFGQSEPPVRTAERVLVAIVPRPDDWALVINERWYRIPLAKAPERVGAEYLAFYLPARFGELGCSIRYYASIERYRLVKRRDLLPDQTRHPRADDRYLKLELGPLLELPHPIPAAKLRRVTFIATTLDRLLVAQEINDLWLRETAKDRLWQGLRERGVEAYRDHVLLSEDGHCLVDVAVPVGQSGLAVDCGPARYGADGLDMAVSLACRDPLPYRIVCLACAGGAAHALTRKRGSRLRVGLAGFSDGLARRDDRSPRPLPDDLVALPELVVAWNGLHRVLVVETQVRTAAFVSAQCCHGDEAGYL